MKVFFPDEIVQKEYKDDKGFWHVARFCGDLTLSDRKLDGEGNVIGEGIYVDGVYKGCREFFTDADGYRHIAEFDEKRRVVSDKKYDGKTLIGEGIYSGGVFVGHKEYSKDSKGVLHVVTFDAKNRPMSDEVVPNSPSQQKAKNSRAQRPVPPQLLK